MIRRLIILTIIIFSGISSLLYSNEIHDAVIDNDLIKTQNLIQADPSNMHLQDEKGNTPLHLAVEQNNIEIVKLLLGFGAKVNAQNKDINTPLQISAVHNYKEIAKYLIENGANVNNQNIAKWSPLHDAASRNYYELMKLLIENGADIESQSRSKLTPLHFAAFRAETKILNYLIQCRADVNTRDEHLYSPLIHAAAFKRYDNAKLLIENGAELDLFTDYGASALHRASLVGASDIIELLIQSGMDVNIVNQENTSALMRGVMFKRLSSVDMLLKYHADTEIKENHYGRTALHKAAILGYGDIVTSLLEAGADIDALDNDKKTPLFYAIKYDHKNIIKMLRQKGAKAKNFSENNEAVFWLNKKLSEKEAVIWYLGGSSWVIKTKNHLLIFDYSKSERIPDNPSLSNGYYLADEFANKKIFVFMTHGKYDRYDTKIFEWQKDNPEITYIYGFDPNKTREHRRNGYDGPEYTQLNPNDSKTIADIDISTIKANEGGVGYLINVDGISLFHLGNHVSRTEESYPDFCKEIDNFMQDHKSVDIAFIPIRHYRISNKEPIVKGFLYTIQSLKPKTIFPMQASDSEDFEFVYTEFRDIIQKKNKSVNIICPDNVGDRYYITY